MCSSDSDPSIGALLLERDTGPAIEGTTLLEVVLLLLADADAPFAAL